MDSEYYICARGYAAPQVRAAAAAVCNEGTNATNATQDEEVVNRRRRNPAVHGKLGSTGKTIVARVSVDTDLQVGSAVE